MLTSTSSKERASRAIIIKIFIPRHYGDRETPECLQIHVRFFLLGRSVCYLTNACASATDWHPIRFVYPRLSHVIFTTKTCKNHFSAGHMCASSWRRSALASCRPHPPPLASAWPEWASTRPHVSIKCASDRRQCFRQRPLPPSLIYDSVREK